MLEQELKEFEEKMLTLHKKLCNTYPYYKEPQRLKAEFYKQVTGQKMSFCIQLNNANIKLHKGKLNLTIFSIFTKANRYYNCRFKN